MHSHGGPWERENPDCAMSRTPKKLPLPAIGGGARIDYGNWPLELELDLRLHVDVICVVITDAAVEAKAVVVVEIALRESVTHEEVSPT